MNIEHMAFNVAEPAAAAAWYRDHLGMNVVRALDEAPHTHFLRDERGVMIEIYRNPPDRVPDYAAMDPLILHLAFISDDPGRDAERLTAASATLEKDERLPDGSHLVMLRDPWGLCIQLCQRGAPFLRNGKG